MDSKLIFNFLGKNFYFKGFEVFGVFHTFNDEEIKIPESQFKSENDKVLIDLKLKLIENENLNNTHFHFYVSLGITKVYCFLNIDDGCLFDFICLDNNFTMKYKTNLLDKINSIDNGHRSRIILINAPQEIIINEDIERISNFIPGILSEKSKKYKSFQVSVFDSKFQNFATKAIIPEIINDNHIIDFLIKNKESLTKFYIEFKQLIDKGESKNESYKEIFDKFPFENIIINFSKKKSILKELFKEKDYLYDLMYYFMLWHICDIYFFPKEKKDNKEIDEKKIIEKNEIIEEVKTSENKEFKPYFTINVVYSYINSFYEDYKKDDDLLIYQKVLLFCSNVYFFIGMKSEEEYKKSNLKYVRLDKSEENSVFKISLKFLNEFIDSLNSKSEIFYPLLLLDSGIYYRNSGSIYGFDFQTCDNIKEHLRDLLPDIIFIYEESYKFPEVYNVKGFNYKGFKTIFLNKVIVLDNYKNDPLKTDNDLKDVKHYGMRTSKFFMHESFGHNKFIFHQNDRPGSPRHFYNKNNVFVTMIQGNEYLKNTNKEEYIKINRKNGNLGESGNFIDYFFGFYNGELIFDYLFYSIKNIGKLIDNVSYFTSPDLKTINEYIIKKYRIQSKNINFEEKTGASLLDDIKEMKSKLGDKDEAIEKKIINPTEKKLLDIKKDSYKNIIFIEQEIEQENGYDYLMKKIAEAKTREEARAYEYELIFHHLKMT